MTERERTVWLCGGCGKVPVKGIYCPECRERKHSEKAAASAEADRARAESMKKRWTERREEMVAAIKAGKSPAKEGKDGTETQGKRKAKDRDLPARRNKADSVRPRGSKA